MSDFTKKFEFADGQQSTNLSKSSVQLLGKLIGLDMKSTSDQLITLNGGNKFVICDIIITNPSTSMTTAADLEVWDTVGRGGNQIFKRTSLMQSLQWFANNNIHLINQEALVLLINPTNYISLKDIVLAYDYNAIPQVNLIGNSIYISLGT